MGKGEIEMPKALHVIPKVNKGGIKKKEKQPQKKKSYLKIDIHQIKNKMRRQNVLFNKLKELKKLKKGLQKQRVKAVEEGKAERLEPLTIEDKREFDETMVVEEDEEILKQEDLDEFADYFDEKQTPKILMTTSENPSKYIFPFLKEIKTTFPNCFYWPRRNFTLKEICQYAPSKDYTDIMIWRENQKEVNQLILIHLPKGPTAFFKVTNVKLNEDIHHHGNPTDHDPELILNNFNTIIGRRIGRFFASLVPQRPEFKGRRVITFHNQRDFIFFRHHRYMFEENQEGSKVNAHLQEVGPRFTLKLEKIQHGTFDNKFGELEWNAKSDMYTSRKAAYL